MTDRAAFLFLSVSLAACQDPKASDTGEPDSGDLTDEVEETWFCDEGSYTIDDGVIETEHYRLYFEIDESEALQMARLAEAAFDAMVDYFDAEPTALPLKAGWYTDFSAFQAAIVADGTTAPDSGGYYWPGTQTAYMFTQPTTYYSRMLFLHELAHQFHFLARTGNDGRDSWYVEGVAEYLSRHDWDGACIRLGRLPMLTWEDTPADALAEGDFDFSGSGDLSRPLAWATYRYLQHEAPDAFDAFRAAYDADASVLLSDHVDVAATTAAVADWLPDEQEPMTPIFLDWIHVTEGVVVGESPYFSMALAKSGETFTASHDTPQGYAGVVAAYTDSSNYSAWLVGADGELWTFVSTGGEALWWPMGTAPVGDRFTWTVSGTTITVNGVAYEESSGFTPRGGVALSGDAVVMESISF
jgi:hypothetical protein